MILELRNKTLKRIIAMSDLNEPCKELNVNFEVTGTVFQTIKIHPDTNMDADELLAHFQKGEALTSINHGGLNGGHKGGLVYLIKDGVIKDIGRVVYQEAMDNTIISLEPESKDED
jgi:hypothetical protein